MKTERILHYFQLVADASKQEDLTTPTNLLDFLLHQYQEKNNSSYSISSLRYDDKKFMGQLLGVTDPAERIQNFCELQQLLESQSYALFKSFDEDGDLVAILAVFLLCVPQYRESSFVEKLVHPAVETALDRLSPPNYPTLEILGELAACASRDDQLKIVEAVLNMPTRHPVTILDTALVIRIFSAYAKMFPFLDDSGDAYQDLRRPYNTLKEHIMYQVLAQLDQWMSGEPPVLPVATYLRIHQTGIFTAMTRYNTFYYKENAVFEHIVTPLGIRVPQTTKIDPETKKSYTRPELIVGYGAYAVIGDGWTRAARAFTEVASCFTSPASKCIAEYIRKNLGESGELTAPEQAIAVAVPPRSESEENVLHQIQSATEMNRNTRVASCDTLTTAFQTSNSSLSKAYAFVAMLHRMEKNEYQTSQPTALELGQFLCSTEHCLQQIDAAHIARPLSPPISVPPDEQKSDQLSVVSGEVKEKHGILLELCGKAHKTIESLGIPKQLQDKNGKLKLSDGGAEGSSYEADILRFLDYQIASIAQSKRTVARSLGDEKGSELQSVPKPPNVATATSTNNTATTARTLPPRNDAQSVSVLPVASLLAQAPAPPNSEPGVREPKKKESREEAPLVAP